MSNAWETTVDDVITVLEKMGENTSKANEIFNDLDFDTIEEAALYGDEMDEQIEYAHKEIQEQVKFHLSLGEK